MGIGTSVWRPSTWSEPRLESREMPFLVRSCTDCPRATSAASEPSGVVALDNPLGVRRGSDSSNGVAHISSLSTRPRNSRQMIAPWESTSNLPSQESRIEQASTRSTASAGRTTAPSSSVTSGTAMTGTPVQRSTRSALRAVAVNAVSSSAAVRSSASPNSPPSPARLVSSVASRTARFWRVRTDRSVPCRPWSGE